MRELKAIIDRAVILLLALTALALAHHSPVWPQANSLCAGSTPGRNEDAHYPLNSHGPGPHTCMHAIVLRFTARKILWHDGRAMLRGHRYLRQVSRLSDMCEGPALNRSTVLRMTTFFWIPVVRLCRCQQIQNACSEDETCPCATRIGSCDLRHGAPLSDLITKCGRSLEALL